MSRLIALVPAVLALTPATASAAGVTTDRSCYLQTPQTTVSVLGAGLPASTPYSVTLDGQPLSGGTGTTDSTGAMHGAFNPPALTLAENQRTFAVGVQAGGEDPTAQFTVTRFFAGFSPSKGDPATLRVRFSVFGFALVTPHPTIYVHYVDPHGRLRTTVRLGRGAGQCGTIQRTRKRHLFPFAHPEHGKWRLQFDTAKRYRAGTNHSSFLFYTVAVLVRKA